jgi:hypothetical protein
MAFTTPNFLWGAFHFSRYIDNGSTQIISLFMHALELAAELSLRPAVRYAGSRGNCLRDIEPIAKPASAL